MLSFAFEISITNSNSLFDLMVADLVSISWMKLFSIAHSLNFLLFHGSIFRDIYWHHIS